MYPNTRELGAHVKTERIVGIRFGIIIAHHVTDRVLRVHGFETRLKPLKTNDTRMADGGVNTEDGGFYVGILQPSNCLTLTLI